MPAANRRALVLALIWTAAAVAILPVISGWSPSSPAAGTALQLRVAAGYFTALALCVWIYRRESRRLSGPQAFTIAFLVALLTGIVDHIHSVMVDYGASYFDDLSNSQWQAQLHRDVMRLSPRVVPHSFRFLPNAIVRWMELGGMNFEAARDLYRLIFVLLLFYAIYCYARLHTTHDGALIAMLLTAVIYPVSFANYAGQLTDPLSHLSFVLAFLFLETEDFACLFAAVMIGALAKETILAMAGYYILFHRRDRHYLWRSCALAAGSVLIYFGVRLWVLGGAMQYRNISGVTLAHVSENWHSGDWVVPVLLTAGSLLPFLAVSWKGTPRSLKQTALFLLPVLFVSGLFFSWLREARNFMPVVFVLAVVAGGKLADQR